VVHPVLDAGTIAVESVEVVELPRLRLHDVDDDVAVVEHDPPPQIGAFHRLVTFTDRLQTHVELREDRTDVGAVLAGDEDEVVRHLEAFTHIDDQDVLGLLLFGEPGGGGGEC